MIQTELEEVTILFAGDSGDGMQLTGSQFTQTAARIGNDISTFPDFPAEIRAPGGTIAGVSGFKLHFGSINIHSPGDMCDVLVAMNSAAFKKNINQLKEKGILIANTSGFDKKNLKLADFESNPLKGLEEKYQIHEIDILKQTQVVLKGFSLSPKIKNRIKNMFALGFVYWLYSRSYKFTQEFLHKRFGDNSDLYNANLAVLKAGYNFGEISDTFTERFQVKKAEMPKGKYRNISGNHAFALGLISAAKQANLNLFYAGYPITPASDLLHFLSRYKKFGVKSFQAEDEIAAVTAAIGASYAGQLAVTASSGPGIALKIEGIGLAMMLEIPLVVINVQRGGPSTGLPTKTEQADLLQALFARNGEAPIPVLAAKSPSDCFDLSLIASKIAIEHMTPVIVLSDGYLANGSEPWLIPDSTTLPKIYANFIPENSDYLPYQRNKDLVRTWAIPGTKGAEHRIGGLEKENLTGNISYNPENHEKMVAIRQGKVDKIAESLPLQSIENDVEEGKVLILSWGSTYGSVQSAMELLQEENASVAHCHVRFMYPFPKNLENILKKFTTILIPELNGGQFAHLIRAKYLIEPKSYKKIQGKPFTAKEIYTKVKQFL